MADNHSAKSRSYNMSQIHNKDTKPEVLVRKYLFSRGLRYRKNDKCYPGHPDIVLPKYKTVVFVHGCFWHMHENCPKSEFPKSNQDFWEPKLLRNRQRDIDNISLLEKAGWKVLLVWGCELEKKARQIRLERLYEQIIEK